MDALTAFSALHPWMQAVLVVIASLFAALIADLLVRTVFRGLAGRTHTTLDDRVLRLLHAPVIWSVVLYGTHQGLGRLEWSDERLVGAERAMQTIVVFLWASFFLRTSGMLLRSASEHQGLKAVEARTLPLFDNLAKLLIVAVAGYGLIAVWDTNPGPWIASAGIVGIAIGFAAQDTLSNFFAGIAIIADAPYRVGDYVNLADGQRGKVVNIGLRSTRILTRDDVEITIPNAVIGGNSIVNESAGPSIKHRVRTQVGVAYGSDLEVVRRVLMEIAGAEELFCDDPEPRVRFRTFGDSGLNIELLGWIPEPEARGRALDAVNSEIYRRFAEEGVEIPYPKRDLYVKEMPGTAPAES
jgi:small-conductance mechanosensitive channel